MRLVLDCRDRAFPWEMVTVVQPEALGGPAAERNQDAGERAVIGTTDANMRIERISNDALALFGRPAAALLGRPLTALVAEPDRAELSAAVAEAARSHAVTLDVHPAASPDGKAGQAPGAYQVSVLAMDPPPSCAFVFVRDATATIGAASPDLVRPGRRSEVAVLGQRLRSLGNVPDLSALTTREWEIVTHLLDGDRVPVIAAELFLAQSTVRSHLALVFDKLGVSSQQELLDLLRGKRAREA